MALAASITAQVHARSWVGLTDEGHTVIARILIFIVVGIAPVYAQQAPDQPSTSVSPPASTTALAAPATAARPATLAPVTAAVPAPSSATSTIPDVQKRARLAGYRTRKLQQGTTVSTVYCKQEANLGSRFVKESCISEAELQEFLLRAEDQRDKLSHQKGTSTDFH